MEKVSDYLERTGEPCPRTRIEQDVKGKTDYVRMAIDVLVREGYASEIPGDAWRPACAARSTLPRGRRMGGIVTSPRPRPTSPRRSSTPPRPSPPTPKGARWWATSPLDLAPRVFYDNAGAAGRKEAER